MVEKKIVSLEYVAKVVLAEAEYNIPHSGRTGRAGLKGLSLAFITEGEMKSVKFIEKALGLSIDKVNVK